MDRRDTQFERFITDLATELDIPESRYESAEKSYKSLAAWLARAESRFADIDVNVYTQGSFRLGTVIRPASDEEDYDLDVVCEFKLSKSQMTQADLHRGLGEEVRAYAAAHGMQEPEPWRRCWTLNYTESSQFHMDLLPAVPDVEQQRRLLAAAVTADFANRAVAITDSKHLNFRRLCDDWPVSNPRGYAMWFYTRMSTFHDMRRRAMMLKEAKVDVAEIPEWRVRTPLQHAVQILKRHRDLRFSSAAEAGAKPSSIVITTLAAHAYNQETSIAQALMNVLGRMDQFVEERGGVWWIPNPSDPRENFADFWREEPRRKKAFDDWLETARTDFRLALEQGSIEPITDTLAPRMGRSLVEKVAMRTTGSGNRSIVARGVDALRNILDAPHRKPPSWRTVHLGTVEIESAVREMSGFRPASFTSNGRPLPKRAQLTFKAATNVSKPYRVYWQIVNTGQQADEAGGLRGGFEEGSVTRGALTKSESTLYRGSHSIECFIVKDDLCVARSGPFIVNIA